MTRIRFQIGRFALCLLMLLGSTAAHADSAADDAFMQTLFAIPEANYREKAALVDVLVAARHEHTREVLLALLDNRLYARENADGNITDLYIVEEQADSQLALTDALSLEDAGTAPEDDLERIRTNITLRKALKQAIARFDLADEDADVRASGVDEMSGDLDDDGAALLREQLAIDGSRQVRRRIEVALALYVLPSGDEATRLAAIETLDGETSNVVYNRIKPLTEADAEVSPELRAAALKVTQSIDSWRAFYGVIETLFFGLSLGSVLVLAAIGLAITFGVMGVINMAHGELIMLGAYTAYVLQLLLPDQIGLALVLAVPAAFVVSGLAGIAIERGVVRFLYGRPLETLLATFGLSLMLQQLVRSIFSPLNRAVASPEWLSGSVQLFGVLPVTSNRLYILLFSLLVFAALQALLRFTRLGLEVRAVSQNRAMARCMGIRSEWVDAATFGLGAGVAGIAGVALSQLTNVGPNLGQAYIIDSFLVVVFGGVGNLWGTLVGAFSLGVANKLLEPWSGAVLAKILVLVFIILFIQRRPRGLFPQRGRAAQG